MDWRDLQTFLAAAETGSTQMAAGTLCLDQSTVSRRLTAFEKQIGQRLFERLPSGLVLTPAGERMLKTAQEVETRIHDLERCMVGSQADLAGDVRLTVPPHTLAEFLGPILARFNARYPEVHLDVDVSMTQANLTKREADIAVRGSDNPPDHLIGRRIGRYHLALYAHRDVAHRAADLPWIGWGESGEMEAWCADHDMRPPGRIWRADHPEAQFGLTLSGLGVGILPCPAADGHPDLVRVLSPGTWPNREIWVLTHKDLLTSPRVRTLFNFLADELTAARPILQGTNA